MDQDEAANTQALETEATAIGWRPKEQFKGDPEKWVDAKTYIERGESVLPIVKATNERLRGDLTRTNVELGTVRAALEQSQKTIEALEKYHQDDVKQKVEQARVKLKAEIVAAKKGGDVEAEVDLTSELSKLDAAEALNAADTELQADRSISKGIPKDYTTDPSFVQWRQENPQFGTDLVWTSVSHAVAAKMRADGVKVIGREFMDMVTVETNKQLKIQPASRKVEGSRGNGGGGGGSTGAKRTYNDLPADARAACDSYERDLVGPTKLHKTQADWRQKYADQYFSEV